MTPRIRLVVLASTVVSIALVALVAVGVRADVVPLAREPDRRPAMAPPVSPPLRIAAASDLALAFAEVLEVYEESTGQKAELSLGSTGLFARQIKEGAPFDVFAAAAVSYVDDVVKSGDCDAATAAPYGQGRIVLWSSNKVGLGAVKDLAALKDPKIVKIAIANPEHAPYGKAARQALQAAGLWDELKPKIVFGENIQQTMQLAKSGNVEVAFVALSLALTSKDGAYTTVDSALHSPIDQALVACGKDPARTAAAKKFAAFVNSPQGRSILRRYGFVLPGEQTASR